MTKRYNELLLSITTQMLDYLSPGDLIDYVLTQQEMSYVCYLA